MGRRGKMSYKTRKRKRAIRAAQKKAHGPRHKEDKMGVDPKRQDELGDEKQDQEHPAAKIPGENATGAAPSTSDAGVEGGEEAVGDGPSGGAEPAPAAPSGDTAGAGGSGGAE